MYKVRFHLAKGKFYKCWQVTSPNGDKDYYDPETHNLFMWGCNLRNQRKTAEKIHSGEHKTVCAWVECDTFGATSKYQGKVRTMQSRYHTTHARNPTGLTIKELMWMT